MIDLQSIATFITALLAIAAFVLGFRSDRKQKKLDVQKTEVSIDSEVDQQLAKLRSEYDAAWEKLRAARDLSERERELYQQKIDDLKVTHEREIETVFTRLNKLETLYFQEKTTREQNERTLKAQIDALQVELNEERRLRQNAESKQRAAEQQLETLRQQLAALKQNGV